MTRALLAACCLLAACATPEVTTRIERVEVPKAIVQPCIKRSDIPALPVPQLAPADASIQRQAAGLAASYVELRHAAEYLLAILQGCAI